MSTVHHWIITRRTQPDPNEWTISRHLPYYLDFTVNSTKRGTPLKKRPLIGLVGQQGLASNPQAISLVSYCVAEAAVLALVSHVLVQEYHLQVYKYGVSRVTLFCSHNEFIRCKIWLHRNRLNTYPGFYMSNCQLSANTHHGPIGQTTNFNNVFLTLEFTPIFAYITVFIY